MPMGETGMWETVDKADICSYDTEERKREFRKT